MAGAAAAYPQDSLVAATNPAGMVWLGNRIDGGLEWFRADQGSRISGNTLGLNGDRDAREKTLFLVPELGGNLMLGARHAIGLAVYGNGGTTRYAENPLTELDGSSPAGLEFRQAIVAPTWAFKVGEHNSFGIALNIVRQRIQARGFEHFDDSFFSLTPGAVTGRGHDHSNGVGFRIGWMGHVTPELALGAAWQPRIRMQRFERYRGLLPDGGSFDVPESWVLGAALKASKAFAVTMDVQRILYAGTRAFGNRADCFLEETCLLGSLEGPGSGWRNVTVLKLGFDYALTPELKLRAGAAYLRQPIPPSQTLLNAFSPAVTEKHLTLGLTWQPAPGHEFTLSYMHAFEGKVNGEDSVPPGPIPGGVGGGEADLRMKQRALGLAWGWRF
jgi:long-chain fatty acid transport protein